MDLEHAVGHDSSDVGPDGHYLPLILDGRKIYVDRRELDASGFYRGDDAYHRHIADLDDD